MDRPATKTRAESSGLVAEKREEEGEMRAAFRLMLAAARLGSIAAQMNLGDYYQDGPVFVETGQRRCTGSSLRSGARSLCSTPTSVWLAKRREASAVPLLVLPCCQNGTPGIQTRYGRALSS